MLDFTRKPLKVRVKREFPGSLLEKSSKYVGK
jgi:hypothetical protein